jgi:cleavage and polyadenylation specificity factor subunit 1
VINFYWRFWPGIAAVLKPLTDTLQGNPRSLQITPAMTGAMAQAKAALAAATGLAHHAPHAELALVCDASDSHVGAVLQQKAKAGWRPLSVFSQKLSLAQSRYSTFDQELTAIFSTLRHFCFLLEVRCFHIVTDHMLLVAALSRSLSPWSARHQQQLAYITEFTTNVSHTPGASNAVADALSRPGPSSRQLPTLPAHCLQLPSQLQRLHLQLHLLSTLLLLSTPPLPGPSSLVPYRILTSQLSPPPKRLVPK